MALLKSTLGLAPAAAYLLLAALALRADFTRGPSPLIFPDTIDLVSFPGMLLLVATGAFGARPELLGPRAGRALSVALTALLAYLVGAGVEALLKFLSVKFK